MMCRAASVLLLVGALGCESEECRRLTGMVGQYQEALQLAQRRAGNAERFQQQSKDAQAKAEATLHRLGLDLPEDALVKELESRVAKIPGATSQRRVESFGPSEEAASNAKTIFTISFEEKDPSKLWAKVALLSEPLPMFRLEMIRTGASPGSWEVDIVRAIVERLPINPKPTPLPEVPDPEKVPSELKYCGAGKLRAELAGLKAQIDALEEAAENTTVLLPTIASWKGLEQRATVLERVELQSRMLQKTLFEVAVATKSKLKAVGYQEPRAVLEVHGGKKERAALEKALAPHRAVLALPEGPQNAEVVRFTLDNTAVPEFRREPAPGTPGSKPDPHEGHGHGPGEH